jgi:hypothetical protein
MTPTIGRIVIYTLAAHDVEAINRARANSQSTGNTVKAGDEFPMLITKIWNAGTDCVSGQVALDGPDHLWVTSRVCASTPVQGSWHWPVPAPLSMPAAFTVETAE